MCRQLSRNLPRDANTTGFETPQPVLMISVIVHSERSQLLCMRWWSWWLLASSSRYQFAEGVMYIVCVLILSEAAFSLQMSILLLQSIFDSHLRTVDRRCFLAQYAGIGTRRELQAKESDSPNSTYVELNSILMCRNRPSALRTIFVQANTLVR
jgi:hypothetical protein